MTEPRLPGSIFLFVSIFSLYHGQSINQAKYSMGKVFEKCFENVIDLGSDGISVLCVIIDTQRRGMFPLPAHAFW